MNYRKHNEDLRILQIEAARPRFGQSPGWKRVDWKPTPSGGNLIFLRQMILPPSCSVRRSDIKIEAPANLYEPAGGGRLFFYRNVWIAPDVRLYDPRTRSWAAMPRLHSRDGDNFSFLCVHPDPVTADRNILDFIRTLDLYWTNPGYKSAAGERM